MEDSRAQESAATIFKVLADVTCRNKILDYVPIKDLVRSETVSEEWRRAVHGYLEKHYDLTLNIWKTRRLFDGPKHRTVSVPPHVYNKTIDKLGPSTVAVLTDRNDVFETLDSKCPRLKSLSLIACNSLVFYRLLFTSYLPNVTHLELDRMSLKTLTKVHLLLDKMPRVESVTLRSNNLVRVYNNGSISLKFLGCFSRLAYLRRLKMYLVFVQTINDALLEALAGCKRLEYLEIAGDKLTKCGRGLAALIRRSPAVVTTLHFVQDVTSKELKDLIKDLEVYGCGDMIAEEVRALREQKSPLELQFRRPNVKDVKLHPDLKITIDSVRLRDDTELEDVWDTEEIDTSSTDSSPRGSDWHLTFQEYELYFDC